MLKAVRASLSFMTTQEKSKWYTITTVRALLSVLDLAGILAIGFVVTSTAVFLTSGSDPNRILEIAGLQIPAVNARTLPWVSAGILVLFLSKALISLILIKRAAFFVATVEAKSAKCIAQVSLGGDLGDARKHSREETLYAIQAGSPAAFNVILNAVNTFISEAMLFVVIIVGFIFVDPTATLAAVMYFGLVALVIQYFVGSKMSKAAKVSVEGSIQAATAISDLLAVFRELLVLRKRDKYVEIIYRARLSAADSAATQYYLSGMPRYVIEASLLVGVTFFILAQALSGNIVSSASTVGVFLAGGFRLTAALLPLQNSLLTIKSAIPIASTAHDVLAQRAIMPSELTEETDIKPTQTLRGPHLKTTGAAGFRFNNVSFRYPNSDRSALTNISFEVEPGAQVAIMGPSGAGKSTIADLLCQVLTPTSGFITRTEVAEPENGLGDFGAVSYVPQKPGLVSGTIIENVALAEEHSEIDRERVLEALDQAYLGDLIEQLPLGLDTPLGKFQDGLSGGQMQRLGLARALYTRPSLLVMDEATSALDAEAEAEIQKALNNIRGKVTVVLIAHRLNTIQHADRVFLVEEGQIRDSGTFKELITRNPSVEKVVSLMRVEES
jgi:ATP-binding cassette subfamily C protein